MRLSSLITVFFAFVASSIIGAHGEEGAPPSRPLTGEYYCGDGMGFNFHLSLTEQATFHFTWQGCMGTYDKNEGTFAVKDGVLQLHPAKPVPKGSHGLREQILVIRWGDRRYMIFPNEMTDFCSAVNDGTEPRTEIHGHFFLQEKDWNIPVTGRPEVPKPWEKYLLAKPVRGKITQLISNEEGWIDLGEKDGVLKGMTLTVHNPKEFGPSVIVEEAEKDRSRIKCRWDDSGLAVGETVSSRLIEE